MTSDVIKANVAYYFRYKRQCPVIVFERGLSYMDIPDVLILSQDRRLIEVEVKVSVSDFRNDAKKRKHNPYWQSHFFPRKQKYYCVPQTMADKIKDLVPQDWGLMQMWETTVIDVLKKAPINKDASRLAIRQVEEMVRHQTATLISEALTNVRLNALLESKTWEVEK